jgi:hypothetical protein
MGVKQKQQQVEGLVLVDAYSSSTHQLASSWVPNLGKQAAYQTDALGHVLTASEQFLTR